MPVQIEIERVAIEPTVEEQEQTEINNQRTFKQMLLDRGERW